MHLEDAATLDSLVDISERDALWRSAKGKSPVRPAAEQTSSARSSSPMSRRITTGLVLTLERNVARTHRTLAEILGKNAQSVDSNGKSAT